MAWIKCILLERTSKYAPIEYVKTQKISNVFGYEKDSEIKIYAQVSGETSKLIYTVKPDIASYTPDVATRNPPGKAREISESERRKKIDHRINEILFDITNEIDDANKKNAHIILDFSSRVFLP